MIWASSFTDSTTYRTNFSQMMRLTCSKLVNDNLIHSIAKEMMHQYNGPLFSNNQSDVKYDTCVISFSLSLVNTSLFFSWDIWWSLKPCGKVERLGLSIKVLSNSHMKPKQNSQDVGKLWSQESCLWGSFSQATNHYSEVKRYSRHQVPKLKLRGGCLKISSNKSSRT